MTVPPPSYDHLLALSTRLGTFEHADHTRPRRSHGYCVDDVARVLVVACREPAPSDALLNLVASSLDFLMAAQGADGTMRNRRTARGRWTGRRSVEDCWGRGLWGFGTVAARHPDAGVRRAALAHFERGAQQRSPWMRAMAFAALGAAEVVAVDPGHAGALELLTDTARSIGIITNGDAWPWPEQRLTYANAVLPEVLIAAGAAIHDDRLVECGVDLLRWLVDHETVGDHVSPTAVGGAGPHDRGPRFDQQPIEVAALADACARAASVTRDPSWLHEVERCVAWFAGDNDAGAVMYDPVTGGGYDGLSADGPNLNQGAESTLAMLSVLQHHQSSLRAVG